MEYMQSDTKTHQNLFVLASLPVSIGMLSWNCRLACEGAAASIPKWKIKTVSIR